MSRSFLAARALLLAGATVASSAHAIDRWNPTPINTAHSVNLIPTVDCTQPGGAVVAGTAASSRCTVSMADADFLKLVSGKLNAQMAFMSPGCAPGQGAQPQQQAKQHSQ